MLLKICFSETATGESDSFDVEVGEIDLEGGAVDGELITRAFDAYVDSFGTQPQAHHPICQFVQKHGRYYGFVATSTDSYFGEMIWTGVVHTLFAVNSDTSVSIT